MARFFNDDDKYMKCPKCNGHFLYEKSIDKYEKNKDGRSFIKYPFYIELRCCECDTVVERLCRDTSAPISYNPLEANNIGK